MAILASVVGAAAVALGLQASLYWDLPTGPAIVVAAALIYVTSFALPMPRSR